MSAQQVYEAGPSIASGFTGEETEAREDEGACPKSRTGGGAGLWTLQRSSLSAELRWAPTQATYKVGVREPRGGGGALQPSWEGPAETERGWFLRIWKGKPAAGPKQEGVVR